MAPHSPRLSGWLNVDKPPGMTSFDVVRRVQQLVGHRHVGHGGTLDPEARGVLPIAVGSATRLLEWCDTAPKRYRGQMLIGTLTDSGDGSGRVSGRSGPPFPSRQALLAVVPFLTGSVAQIPPQVSALKQGGVRLYAKVRRGRSVWPAPRQVDVHRIDLTDASGDHWDIDIVAGPGMYVRALVRDWGGLVGHAAHLENLERVQAGVFRLADAVPLADLAKRWPHVLLPAQSALTIPQRPLLPEHRRAVASGQLLSEWPELSGAVGEVALIDNDQVACVMVGPPWRFRKVFLRLGKSASEEAMKGMKGMKRMDEMDGAD